MFKIQLVWAKTIAPDVRHLAFKPVDAQILSFIPGQFITIHFEHQGKSLNRSYSLATMQDQSEWIEIAVSFVKEGPASQLLFGIQPGDVLEATGPFGRLVLQPEIPKRYLLIATGTGVTPYRAMLPELAKRHIENPSLQIMLALGVRSREHLLYGDAFVQFAAQYPRFQFFACYSRLFPENPLFYEHPGRVHQLFETLAPDPTRDIVYLCGNPTMIDDVFTLLRQKGFTVSQVRREKYISPHVATHR